MFSSMIRSVVPRVTFYFSDKGHSFIYLDCNRSINKSFPIIAKNYQSQIQQFSKMAQAGTGHWQSGQPQLAGGPVQPQRINSNLFCLSRTTLANFNRFLSKAVDTQTLNFQQVDEEIKSGKDILLIDVREKDETINDGKIPTSKNIPLGELATAIQLENHEFQERYGFEKPKTTQSIVVHCRKGPRAFNAASILKYGGYPSVRVYSGILDWKENGGALESP